MTPTGIRRATQPYFARLYNIREQQERPPWWRKGAATIVERDGIVVEQIKEIDVLLLEDKAWKKGMLMSPVDLASEASLPPARRTKR